jgi:gamma-glutamyltranspeptidase
MSWLVDSDWSHSGERTGFRSAYGRRAMVSTTHDLATRTGIRVLEDGGNAVDAAIAASGVLAVVLPQQCSLGGDAFWLVSDRTGAVEALNGSGRSGALANAPALADRGWSNMPERGGPAVTVPGLVDSWTHMHRRFASVALTDLLKPAIDLAEHGVHITPHLNRALTENASDLRVSELGRIFLPQDRIPPVGDLLRQPELADSLRHIAARPRDLYEGDLATSLVEAVRADRGFLELSDLAGHESEWVKPLSVSYGDYSLVTPPPNSQGVAALLSLALLQKLTGGKRPTLAQQVWAKRVAFSVRDKFVGEPEGMSSAPESLVTDGFVDDLFSAHAGGKGHAATIAGPMDLGGTVAFAAADVSGMSVSGLHSTFFDFGSLLSIPGTGIVLQNRGASFLATAGHPNSLVPRARPLHTLTPAMLLSRGRVAGLLGAMGGHGQPQTLIQLVVRLIHDGLDPADAIASPRWYDSLGPSGEVVFVEEGYDEEEVKGSRALGLRIEGVSRFEQKMGHAQLLLRDVDTGVLIGGADPRGEGLALGL